MSDGKTLLFACAAALPLLVLTVSAGPAAEPALPRSAAEHARVASVTASPRNFLAAEPYEALLGGLATSGAPADRAAFSHPAPGLGETARLDFQLGNRLFRKIWVSAPSSTLASDGLGPLYNARACALCHPQDGRGRPPEGPGQAEPSTILRLSRPGGAAPDIAEWIATVPDPVYGGQIQPLSLPGIPGEGRADLHYTETPVTLADGTVVSLRRPDWRLADPGYGPLDPAVMLSPRVAPAMIGLGLLEAIPAEDILAHADPADRDGDGVSGRAALVPGPEGQPMLGRFGWKAGMATIRDQVAAAFTSDIGISTPLTPLAAGDCTAAQIACRAAPDGADATRGGVEIDAESLDLVAFYAGALAVPARRDPGAPQVLAGKQVFHQVGCPACHIPKFVTARLPDAAERSFQLIWPYSDLLLHDMGEGLADNRPEGRASGREWRTPPLWGIGLTGLVSGHTFFLHDGRARNLLEAILWHGGEAAPQQAAVIALPKPDRDALLAFLESL